jgi:hypothetical protein
MLTNIRREDVNRIFRLFLERNHRTALDLLAEQYAIWSAGRRFRSLSWESIQDNPIERVEPACVTFKERLCMLAGYRNLDEVVRSMSILDLNTGQWEEHIDLPGSVPQTHQGVVIEADRYLYNLAGQLGIQCSPAVAACFVLDLETRQWTTLPSLPAARYAPVTRLWNERIHVLAGSKEDRVTPASEHWSLAIKDGKATENRWREEPPIPKGGPHRSSAVVADRLFVLAGQWKDRPPIQGDPRYTCDWTAPEEIFYPDSFVLERGRDWQRIADMPIAVTHSEYATVVIDQSIVVLGGLMDKSTLTDLIQVYDTSKDQWTIVGRLPTRNKGCVGAYHQGWLYVIAGQKEVNRSTPTVGDVLKCGWRTRFSLNDSESTR